MREFCMEKFDLEKPISQLLNVLKSNIFWHVNFFQIGLVLNN